MRTRKHIFIFGLILLTLNGWTQYSPFQDYQSRKWGVRNDSTNEIVIPAEYRKFVYNNDTLFIYMTDSNLFSGITVNGYVMDTSNHPTYINYVDPLYSKSLIEVPITDTNGNKSNRWYLIDFDRNCIPTDYYSCPYWKKMKFDTIPDYFEMILIGEQARGKKDIDSAIIYCKRAIELAPENPFVYYWGADMLLLNWQEDINSKNNQDYIQYFDWVEMCLDKANALEDNDYYRWLILRLQTKFYKNTRKDKEKYKLYKKELEENEARRKKTMANTQ